MRWSGKHSDISEINHFIIANKIDFAKMQTDLMVKPNHLYATVGSVS